MTVTLFVKRARIEAAENNIAIKFIQSYISYSKSKEHLKSITTASLEEIEDLVVYPRNNENEVHVLILGESTSRLHMGLYGYDRNTNPRLSKINDELYIFKDVISPYSHTIPIMRELFTFSNYENENVNSKSLIQYVRKAGYKTYWISNQYKGDAVVDVLAQGSDVTFYVNKKENYIGEKCLDSNVFLPLSTALKEKVKKKFIVIHLLGTHGNYRKRYPSSFMKFTSSKRPYKDWAWMVNEYDNAVLYNDYIVSTIIDKVKKKGVFSTVLFFSDHGEDVFDVGDFALHTEMLGTFPMFTIPFILWLSPKYKKINEEMVADLNTYLDRKYMTDDVIHSIFDLLNIKSTNYRDSKSVFNKKFEGRKRKIGKLDFDNEISLIKNNKEYEESAISFDNYDSSIKNKIWVHRVNSKDKLQQAVDRFTGVELDVVFINSQNKYDVNHPPQESINLSLDEYLSSIGNSNKYSLWLDFKSVNQGDMHASLIKMNDLVQKYELSKHKIVVESRNSTMLKLFNMNGYFTSYYLTNTSEDTANILNTKKIINGGSADAVSAHADNLIFIQQYLKEVKNILLWAPELDIDNKYHRAKIRRILFSDRRIKVLLVHLDSKYYR
jgi:heptose-I-phosphate ethanolaminephosphotransferase